MPILLLCTACAHRGAVKEGYQNQSKLDSEVVQEAVVFEHGSKDGAVVPEISAPSLRAVMVEERIEGNRLIERHREWILEGEVQLLGIPKELRKPPVIQPKQGGTHEN